MHIEGIIKNPKSISIDTRTIKKGDVFLAIKGKRFDGHDFAGEALKKGAEKAIVGRIPRLSARYKKKLIKVKDTVSALGDIALSHRQKFNIPVIAITGSNGKTTAKDIVSHVLSKKYNVLKNEASKNNLIGLPLTLLGLKKEHQVAVLEMGMNHLGEIARLSKIAKPNIGVITNVGLSHLEFLGNLKNIFKAKSELLKELSAEDSAILNKDDRYLASINGLKCRKVYFGIEKKCEFQARRLANKGNKWFFSLGKKENFEISLIGRHNIYNALIAIALARQFDMDFSVIAKGVKSYRQTSCMRLEFKNIRGIKILDDSYNSNPLAMECAINTLAGYNTHGKRILVSGDMLELGKKAKILHETAGKQVASRPIDFLITVGEYSRFMNKEAERRGMANLRHAKSHGGAARILKKLAKPGDVVLVKGSRGMEMEKVIKKFKDV